MDRNYTWGTHNEMIVLAHMAGINMASYNINDNYYHFIHPGLIDSNAYPKDNTRPTIYFSYTGDHFNLVLSQDSSLSLIQVAETPAAFILSIL